LTIVPYEIPNKNTTTRIIINAAKTNLKREDKIFPKNKNKIIKIVKKMIVVIVILKQEGNNPI